MNRRWLVLPLAAISIAALLLWQRPLTSSQARPAAVAADPVVTFRVRFGVGDADPAKWDGTVAVTSGELVNLRDWRPRPSNKVEKASFTLSTERGPNFTWRPWENTPVGGTKPYLLIPGVIVDVRATGATRVAFRTAQGNFTVEPARLAPGSPVSLLNGRVVVERAIGAERMSAGDYQNEFPALSAGPNGELWLAWVAWTPKGNEILARRFDGKSWSEARKVTDGPADIFHVKLARGRDGKHHAIWAEQRNGNFDLYTRPVDGGVVERLTEDPQPDVYHSTVADAAGNVWVVWQGFRNGKSDIFARRFDGSAWSTAERVSTAPANDWEPVVAAAPNGAIAVAWDTYDKGNYDVMMRQYANGAWSEIAPVADTPRFEAHVSLAFDKQNRLWATWNESGFEWGKDVGYLPKLQGTALYSWRGIGVAVRTPEGWQEPVANLDESLPPALRNYNDYPMLQADGAGRVWLFFRHRNLRIADTPAETPAHRAAWETFATTLAGSKWIDPVPAPNSNNRTDIRGALATGSSGAIHYAWSTDNRNYEDFLFRHADVYAGRVPTVSPSAPAPALRARATPKITYFRNHPSEAEDLKRIQNYAIQSGGKTYRIYRGDTHRHTEFSMDGNNDGSLAQTYRYAIDAASLDFLMVSEHNGLGGPDEGYINNLLQQMCDVLMIPRTFTPFYGYERSVVFPNGHRNVIFTKRGIPTLPIPAAEAKAQQGAAALYAYLKRYGGIAISHTSASSMGTDWRDNDPEVEPLVEIYQGDRVSAEYEGAPKAAYAGNPASAPGGFRPEGYVWNAWAKGYKLGVQAASDHYSTHISYACTIAEDGTRDGLLSAMKARHSYGATDNIILDYRLQTGGREYLQGDILPVSGGFQLKVKTIGTDRIRQIDIVRNNTFIHTRHPMQKEVDFTYLDNQPLAGESYYYVRVIQVNDQIAWSSPIWIKR